MAHTMVHPHMLGHFHRDTRDPLDALFGRQLQLYGNHLQEELPSTMPMAPNGGAWAIMNQHHHHHSHYSRRMYTHTQQCPNKSGVSEINCTKDKFEVKLDCHHFTKDELGVKTTDKHVVVEGHHEEKEDAHGLIARHFLRRYLLPQNAKEEDISCHLSQDGLLLIEVPRVEMDPEEEDENEAKKAKVFPINERHGFQNNFLACCGAPETK